MSLILTSSVLFVVILLFGLPIEVDPCSMNTNDIIDLMAQNPNFGDDPCYIKWQADQDDKLKQLWAQREKLELWEREYRARERENRQRSYSSSTANQTSVK